MSSDTNDATAPQAEPTSRIWDLAEKSQAEVDAWPEWKRRAADMALVTPRSEREPEGVAGERSEPAPTTEPPAAPPSEPASANRVQARPTPGHGVAIWDLVIADARERDAMGTAKYGQRLQAGDGRDHIVDAYQEALDLAVYLRQEIEERGQAARREPAAVKLATARARIAELEAERDKMLSYISGAEQEVFRLCRELAEAKRERDSYPGSDPEEVWRDDK